MLLLGDSECGNRYGVVLIELVVEKVCWYIRSVFLFLLLVAKKIAWVDI